MDEEPLPEVPQDAPAVQETPAAGEGATEMAKKAAKKKVAKRKAAVARASAPRTVRTGKKGLLLITSADLPRVCKALQVAATAATDDAEKSALQRLAARAKERI